MGLPVPNLDDKTFDQIVEDARLLISRFAPQWTDHNVHDPGITFIELFSWIAEMQHYQLNRITDDHKRAYLKLIGFCPHDRSPAKVDITFADVTGITFVGAGTLFDTKLGDEKITFETEEDYYLVPVRISSIKSKFDSKTADNTQANEKEGINYAPFGDSASQGAEIRVGLDSALPPGKDIALTVYLFEEDLDLPGSFGDEPEEVIASVSVVWEYLRRDEKWEPLTIKKDTTMSMTRSGKIILRGPAVMYEDEYYWIRCRLIKGQYEIIPIVSTILLNTISASQIETVKNEELIPGTGSPGHKVLLKKKPVIIGCLSIEVRNSDGKWEEWFEVDTFEDSAPDDRHYMIDSEEGEVMFGNGLNGLVPAESRDIRAGVYKTTLGSKGNIPAGLAFRVSNIAGKNLKEATGGQDPETVEQTIARARRDFKTPYRAITSHDYEQLAIATPGLRVDRAKALPDYHPQFPCIKIPGRVSVVVVPLSRKGRKAMPVAGDGFLKTVENHLNRHRLVTTDIHVIGPVYVKVSVKCTVYVKKKSGPEKVEERLIRELNSFLDPLQGGPDKNGWPFGRPVFPSEIYQLIDKVEGVNYVIDVLLSSGGKLLEKGKSIEISRNGLIYAGEHEIKKM